MTKTEYITLLDIYLCSIETYNEVFNLLMGGGHNIPNALGQEDGFFGKITKLEQILFFHSNIKTMDEFVSIISDEKTSITEKVDILL